MQIIQPKNKKLILQRAKKISNSLYNKNYYKLADREIYNILKEDFGIAYTKGLGRFASKPLGSSLAKNLDDFLLGKNYNMLEEYKMLTYGNYGINELEEKIVGITNKYLAFGDVEKQYIFSSSVNAVQYEEEFMPLEDTHYMTYHSTNDGLTRADHAELDGISLPLSDPFWDNFYPGEWDWNCRCYGTMDRIDSLTPQQKLNSITKMQQVGIVNKFPELSKNSAKSGEYFTSTHNNLKNIPKNIKENL